MAAIKPSLICFLVSALVVLAFHFVRGDELNGYSLVAPCAAAVGGAFGGWVRHRGVSHREPPGE